MISTAVIDVWFKTRGVLFFAMGHRPFQTVVPALANAFADSRWVTRRSMLGRSANGGLQEGT